MVVDSAELVNVKCRMCCMSACTTGATQSRHQDLVFDQNKISLGTVEQV
jgi:hypothetical protein